VTKSGSWLLALGCWWLVSGGNFNALELQAVEPPTQPAAPAAQLSAPQYVGELPNAVKESSGLVKSRRGDEKKIFWTLSDSGDAARIYSFEARGGLLRKVDIPGAANIDWEDLAADDHGRLVIADIGDNLRRRKTIELYRLFEPDPQNPDIQKIEAQKFSYRYPAKDGAADAEALFVRGDSAYLFTKDTTATKLYKLPLPVLNKDEVIEATLIATTNTFTVITGAAISPDGKRIALVNYLTAVVIDLPKPFEELADPKEIFDAPRRSRLMLLGQTEAVAWDGDDLMLTTEGGALYRVPSAASAPKP
jgi:hypothetical protein